MTKDDILSMAKAAGFPEWWFNPPEIERKNDEALNLLLRFAALVAEKEREECAKVCEAEGQSPYATKHAATNIRARGQKEYRGARLVLTKDGVIQDGWMGDK
jgi:hypothetical protein